MNESNHDPSPILFFGCILVVVLALAGAALNAVKQLLNQLALMFDAFGKAVESFFPMLLRVLGMVSLVAASISVVVAAVYFSVKYIQIVRRATAIREQLHTEMRKFKEEVREIENSFNWSVIALETRTRRVEEKLHELLKPANAASAVTPATSPDPEDKTRLLAPQSTLTQIPVSQPY